ncbi:MAG: hypothetical protein GX102_04000 [Porphyromonadaceae bacterium]|jgi:uncharacterized protein YdeI (YjbR/CyaY-like superfamily)|nr:hypothetical protein [Porphyromonadaceae bacterium]
MEKFFKNRNSFRSWLINNHDTSQGIHILFCKGETLTYDEALEEALCFGWIDGVVKSIDINKYTRYFTRRTRRSNWSEKNKTTVMKLLDDGLVALPGLKAIKEAKRNGMWERIQQSEVNEELFIEFRKLISASQLALENYDEMSLSVKKTYVLFYNDAKTELGRTNRLAKIISRLEQNLKPM